MATTQQTQPTETTGKPVAEPRRGQFLSPLDEFDQWFEDIRRNWMQPFLFGRGWPEAGLPGVLGRMPRVDVIERDNEFCVRAELPGVTKDNLDVSLQENTLTLRATTRKEEEEEKGQYYRRELSHGEFQRTVRLPGLVDGDKAKATFKDGVLELIVPKAEGAKRQTVTIE
jgi:HSP20 family protein